MSAIYVLASVLCLDSYQQKLSNNIYHGSYDLYGVNVTHGVYDLFDVTVIHGVYGLCTMTKYMAPMILIRYNIYQ